MLVIDHRDAGIADVVLEAAADRTIALRVARHFRRHGAASQRGTARERVEPRHRQSAELANVLGHVVVAARRHGIHHEDRVARRDRHGVVVDQDVIEDVVLPAQRYAAVLRGQPREGLAPEQAPALGSGAGVEVEAVLEHEQGLQAVAKVLGAPDAPARARQVARCHAGQAMVVRIGMGQELDTGIGNAIQRDR
ncbi:hypothetical protein D3C85_1009030 [compost metagenome]